MPTEIEDEPKRPPSLHAAALWYASKGLHLFPLLPGGKTPYKGTHGSKDATTDPERVNRWWAQHPDSNIGLATGYQFDVIDIDGLIGHKSRSAHWHCPEHYHDPEIISWIQCGEGKCPRCRKCRFASIEGDALGKVLTPRPGGMHIYVPASGEPNGQSLLPGIDYRGTGGYVVAPPSITPAGTYRWLGEPHGLL